MAKRISRRIVALSSSAIAAVYLAGYVRTQAVAAQLAAAEAGIPLARGVASPTPAVRPAAQPGGALPNGGVPPQNPTTQRSSPGSLSPQSAGAQTPLPNSSQAAAASQPLLPAQPPAGGYHDGTFVGYGTSRRGDVEVTLTIQEGRIVSCVISRCLTQYPQSRINGLPGQVVARQTAAVDRVTGATYSTQAFRDAVAAALRQAAA